MITSTAELRTLFLDYFRKQDHLVLPSAPLVPANDPTLMFTNAGMVQFKDVFVGDRPPRTPRAASVQKCIRISGKHNDLENVGRTSRHHTFFEMLGNFSFGDYFKKEACHFGWELLTKGFGLDPENLWVTVFAGDENAPADEETASIWRDVIGVPATRIKRLGAKDNFWAMGDTGPCGPCSEIHFDRGAAFGADDIENGERFFELWNLVFMQYLVDKPGSKMKPLPRPCIDTGAGLERIASVLQGVESNYDIDIFVPLIKKTAQLANKQYGTNPENDVSIRVVADHARMTAFLIAEGIFPEKSSREYVLRRVMRRAIRHGHRLGIDDLFLHEIADQVVETMHDTYPELNEFRDLIGQICRQEEERFRSTMERGLDLLKETRDWSTGPSGERILPGAIAFDLTATYGFPRDLIEVIGQEQNFSIDDAGFLEAEQQHKAVSGTGKIGEAKVASIYHELLDALGSTTFTGYRENSSPAQVLAIIEHGATIEGASTEKQIEIVLDVTPFYGESGGQVGDRGMITGSNGHIKVTHATRPISNLTIHHGIVTKGQIRVGDKVTAAVDADHRDAIRRHHTVTHLLHSALRQTLGPHATQKGSRVDADNLRFDFAHFEPVTTEQLEQIEHLVTAKIMENHKVDTTELPYDQARKLGATALFGENYEDVVRMVTVSPDSIELCGGTHVVHSGEIGTFCITNETGIAAGVRRIEAVAGLAASRLITNQRRTLNTAAGILKVGSEMLVDRLERLIAQERNATREIEVLKRRLAGGGKDLMANVREVEGIKVLGLKLEVGDPATLRDTADTLRQKIGSGVICLGGENKGKAALVVTVTKDLTSQIPAGQLIREVASLVGGKGGGRPDFAQAGGPDISGLKAATEEIYAAVDRAIKTK
jgi:alanyl-tRNA synthetase